MQTAISGVASLRPTQKAKVIEVVAQAGIDVSDWAASTTGNPDSNPRYCYEWAFSDEAGRTLLCLWFNNLEEGEEGVFQSFTLWPAIRQLEALGKGSSAKRADRLDRALQIAFARKAPVRVAVVDGRQRMGFDEAASKVEFRQLDDTPWFVTDYNRDDGTFVIRRQPGNLSGAEHRLPPASLAKPIQTSEQSSNPPLLESEDQLGEHESALDLAEDLGELAQRTDLAPTTRAALVEARLGQGGFRKAVMNAWNHACAATGCGLSNVLRASHIKPWRRSNDGERLDPENGLMLTANLDALFDGGLISFDDEGTLLVSCLLPEQLQAELMLPAKLLRAPSARQRGYLGHHHNHIFKP